MKIKKDLHVLPCIYVWSTDKISNIKQIHNYRVNGTYLPALSITKQRLIILDSELTPIPYIESTVLRVSSTLGFLTQKILKIQRQKSPCTIVLFGAF